MVHDVFSNGELVMLRAVLMVVAIMLSGCNSYDFNNLDRIGDGNGILEHSHYSSTSEE